MSKDYFNKRFNSLKKEYKKIITAKNKKVLPGNGIFERYINPVITREHTPLSWRYDLNYKTNPFLMERMGINSTFNSGAIELNGKMYLCVRVEGFDRKSFFAIAESKNGTDNFKFWDFPVIMPETDEPDVNIYDMRLVKHQDGFIYGLFCSERLDTAKKIKDGKYNPVAQCGIARTKDLIKWERLKDLTTQSPQQRNCVLHPEFINGKYAFYTRPLADFCATGSGEGIGWGLCDNITNAVIEHEEIFETLEYHTIKDGKIGLGPSPIKTAKGWLQLAHAVRDTAAGMRYVLYLFLTDIKQPNKIIKAPGGYLLAPYGSERTGDVDNVVFCNGWIAKKDGKIFIYYGASDTRMNVVETSIAKLLDYVENTVPDGITSAACVKQRIQLINKNI